MPPGRISSWVNDSDVSLCSAKCDVNRTRWSSAFAQICDSPEQPQTAYAVELGVCQLGANHLTSPVGRQPPWLLLATHVRPERDSPHVDKSQRLFGPPSELHCASPEQPLTAYAVELGVCQLGANHLTSPAGRQPPWLHLATHVRPERSSPHIDKSQGFSDRHRNYSIL